MTTDLVTKLPPELLLQVLGYLDEDDLRALSLTSSLLRVTTAPRLFRGLLLSNNAPHLKGLKSVLSKYSQYVIRIRYNCNLFPREEESRTDVLPMPQIIQDALAGESLSNLELVELAFYPENDFHGHEVMENTSSWMNDTPMYEGLDSIWLFQEPESSSQMQQEENNYQWRADIVALFDTISKNKQIKQLEILNLIPVQCSSWRTESWVKFIGRLTKLGLMIWGGGDGVEAYVNTMPGYQSFLECVGPTFFQNSSALRQLHLAGADRDVADGEGYLMSITLLAISVDNLPFLEHLIFESCYIDESLLSFLSSRLIRSITLIDCWHLLDENGENITTWATFFSPLQGMEPKNLTKFTISGTNPVEIDFTAQGKEEHERRYDHGRGEVESFRRRLEKSNDSNSFNTEK